MCKMQGSALIALIVGLALVAIGVGSHYYYHKDDNPVEEEMEELLESEIENVFELPQHTMDGKIDFTPESKEESK